MKTCSIDGCTNGGKIVRGWCQKHYYRWRRHGDPHAVKTVHGQDEDRFRDRIEVTSDGCWRWTGSCADTGYATMSVDGVTTYMHRWSYEHHVRPVPEGLQLDHLCRTRSCVNPRHLEPVTELENKARGESPSARNARKTHCIRGHEFTPENTYRPAGGGRQCRECKRARDRGDCHPPETAPIRERQLEEVAPA